MLIVCLICVTVISSLNILIHLIFTIIQWSKHCYFWSLPESVPGPCKYSQFERENKLENSLQRKHPREVEKVAWIQYQTKCTPWSRGNFQRASACIEFQGRGDGEEFKITMAEFFSWFQAKLKVTHLRSSDNPNLRKYNQNHI